MKAFLVWFPEAFLKTLDTVLLVIVGVPLCAATPYQPKCKQR